MSLIQSPLLLATSNLPDSLIKSCSRPYGAVFSKCCFRRLHKSDISGVKRGFSRILCSKSSEEPQSLKNQQSYLQPWDAPWDWKVTLYIMLPYLMSIVFTGLVGSAGLTAFQPHSQNAEPHLDNIDEVAIRLFVDQLLKTVAKLSILYAFVSPYQPFPDDIFSYKWSKPLDLQHGWMVWGGGGLVIALGAVFLIKAFIFGSAADQIPNETESWVRLLPLVGASRTSTFCLLGVLGVLAPFCEETLYRGFLMTSLTKWLPVPISAVLSSVVFTFAHQSPGKSLEIFTVGMILGLVYSKTRNLLAPIAMHAFWNLGFILTLTFLQSQGYDIQG